MKRRTINLAVSIPRLVQPRRTNKTIHTFINRIPCYEQDFKVKSELLTYLKEEMSDYPIINYQKERKTSQQDGRVGLKSRSQVAHQKIQKIRSGKKSSEERLDVLSERIRKELHYFDLQEAGDLIRRVKGIEARNSKPMIRKIANHVGYSLKSETHTAHVAQAAKELVRDIELFAAKKISRIS